MTQGPEQPPQFDADGMNILDPRDGRGHKSRYITMVQAEALRRLLPPGPGLLLDVGCGWGRLDRTLVEMGWSVVGVDPDVSQIQFASLSGSGARYVVSGLPDLPIRHASTDLLLLHNVVRPLLLRGRLDVVEVAPYLRPGGRLVVVDNLRVGEAEYVDETDLIRMFEDQGMRYLGRQIVRAGRSWFLPLIGAGVIPRSWYPLVASMEVSFRARFTKPGRWRYVNGVFSFEKTGAGVPGIAQSD